MIWNQFLDSLILYRNAFFHHLGICLMKDVENLDINVEGSAICKRYPNMEFKLEYLLLLGKIVMYLIGKKVYLHFKVSEHSNYALILN